MSIHIAGNVLDCSRASKGEVAIDMQVRLFTAAEESRRAKYVMRILMRLFDPKSGAPETRVTL